MKALIKVSGVYETPKRWAISGSNPTRLDVKEDLIDKEFKDLHKNSSPLEVVAYRDKLGKLRIMEIEEFEMTSNMSNTCTLNILLGNINLPEEIKEGTTIYRA